MKYIKFYFNIMKREICSQTEYRISFWLDIIGNLLSFLLVLFFFEVIYLHIESIGGWTKYEVIILVCLSQIVDSLYEMFFGSGVTQIPRHILQGTMDNILTKPINSQFFLSIRKFRWQELGGTIYPIIPLVYALNHLPVNISFIKVVCTCILIISGVIIRYSFAITLVTTSFWFVKSEALYSLYQELFTLTRYPASIYKGATKLIFTFVIPVIIVANFPAMILIRSTTFLHFFLGLSISIFFFFISCQFWRFGKKHYTSTSS